MHYKGLLSVLVIFIGFNFSSISMQKELEQDSQLEEEFIAAAIKGTQKESACEAEIHKDLRSAINENDYQMIASLLGSDTINAQGAFCNTLGIFVNTLLIMSAAKGSKEIVELLIDKYTYINAQDSQNNTALHAAAINGHKEIVELLLNKNANVQAKNSNGDAALHLAAYKNYKEIVELLLDRGTNIHTKNSHGNTALHWAAYYGHKEVVILLLDRDADINAQDNQGNTALHFAAKHGHQEIIKLLMARGATPDIKNSKGDTALLRATNNCDDAQKNCVNAALVSAAKLGLKKVVAALLDKGTNVNAKEDENNDNTALHWATYRGHKEVVELLLDKGANIYAKNNYGNTVLCCAVHGNHKEVIESLLKRGADINAKNNNGATALHWATTYCPKEIVELLLDKGADINAKSNYGFTPLHYAAKCGSKEIIELLFGKGADIHAKDNNGATALHWAVAKNHKEIVILLLNKGIDIHAKNIVGNTALHLAAYMNHKEITEFLIDRGADINAQDNESKTALMYAEEQGHKGIVYLLRNSMEPRRCTICLEDCQQNGHITALPCGHTFHASCISNYIKLENNSCPLCKQIPAELDVTRFDAQLLFAVAVGNTERVIQALKQGASINAQDEDGHTPLFIAAALGRTPIVHTLLTHADINSFNEFDKSLEIAVQKGHKAIIQLLLGYGALVDKTNKELIEALGKVLNNQLLLAAIFGDISQLESLLEKEKELPLLQDALLLAAAQGHTAFIKHLLPPFVNQKENVFFENHVLPRIRIVRARCKVKELVEQYRLIEDLLLAVLPIKARPISCTEFRLGSANF